MSDTPTLSLFDALGEFVRRAPGCFCAVDAVAGHVLAANEAYRTLARACAVASIGASSADAPQFFQDLRARLLAALASGGEATGLEVHLRRADGTVFQGIASASKTELGSRQVLLVSIARADVLGEALRGRSEADARLRGLAAAVTDAVLEVDDEYRVTGVLAEGARTAGFVPLSPLARPLWELLRMTGDRALQEVLIAQGRATSTRVFDVVRLGDSGGERAATLTLVRATDGAGELRGYLAVVSDVSDRRRLEAEVRRLTTTDAVTGVCNRPALMDQAAVELRRSRRYGRPLSLLLVDVGDLRAINEVHGPSAGDRVLREVVAICKRQLRAVDVVARYAQQQFAIVLPETTPMGAEVAAKRLRRTAESTRFDGVAGEFTITLSVGAATADAEEISVDVLLQRADAALVEARQKKPSAQDTSAS